MPLKIVPAKKQECFSTFEERIHNHFLFHINIIKTANYFLIIMLLKREASV